MPAARHFSRSPTMALAVIAITGIWLILGAAGGFVYWHVRGAGASTPISQLLNTHVADCEDATEGEPPEVGPVPRFVALETFRQALRNRPVLTTTVVSVLVVASLLIAQQVSRLAAGVEVQPPAWEEDDVLNRRVLIQGDTFLMGSAEDDPDAFADERPQHRVTVSDFYLQEHEVTNEEYRRFNPDHDPDAPDEHPVVHVNWQEAMDYAAWLGGTLPTEAQWEFAARGRDGRKYPWGDEDPNCERANYSGCGGPVRAVKSYEAGATPEDIYDLAGNVWEWCRDGKREYSDEAQVDPVGPLDAPARVLRGGSFIVIPRFLRAAYHGSPDPDIRRGGVGFRVAWASSGGLE